MVRVFGAQDRKIGGLESTGAFNFEDSNLDMFTVIEDRNT
jgi:hypothetical protein